MIAGSERRVSGVGVPAPLLTMSTLVNRSYVYWRDTVHQYLKFRLDVSTEPQWPFDNRVWDDDNHPVVKCSKHLSYVLRHAAKKNNFAVDSTLFIDVQELYVASRPHHAIRDPVVFAFAVAKNPKGRSEE